MNMQDVQKWMGDNKTDAALRDHNAEIEGGGLPSGRMSIKTGMGMILTRDPRQPFSPTQIQEINWQLAFIIIRQTSKKPAHGKAYKSN